MYMKKNIFPIENIIRTQIKTWTSKNLKRNQILPSTNQVPKWHKKEPNLVPSNQHWPHCLPSTISPPELRSTMVTQAELNAAIQEREDLEDAKNAEIAELRRAYEEALLAARAQVGTA